MSKERTLFEHEFPRTEVDVGSRTVSVYWTPNEYEAAFAGWKAAVTAERKVSDKLLEALKSVLDSFGAMTKNHELYNYMGDEDAERVFALIAEVEELRRSERSEVALKKEKEDA